MTNETQVELVRFEADGLEEITEQTEIFGRELTATEKRYADLARRINSPAFANHARQMAVVNRQYERAKQLERDMNRRAELQGRYGRVGGAMAAWGERSGATGLAARVGGIGAAAVTGLAAKGLSGSAEMALLEQRMDRLAKAVAGAAVPAVERLTGWAEKLEDVTRGMSGRQQSALASIGGGALVGGAVGGKKGALLGGAVGLADVGGTFIGEMIAKALGWPTGGDARTDVTPYNPGMHDLGSAYEEAFRVSQTTSTRNERDAEQLGFFEELKTSLMWIRMAIERELDNPARGK